MHGLGQEEELTAQMGATTGSLEPHRRPYTRIDRGHGPRGAGLHPPARRASFDHTKILETTSSQLKPWEGESSHSAKDAMQAQVCTFRLAMPAGREVGHGDGYLAVS